MIDLAGYQDIIASAQRAWDRARAPWGQLTLATATRSCATVEMLLKPILGTDLYVAVLNYMITQESSDIHAAIVAVEDERAHRYFSSLSYGASGTYYVVERRTSNGGLPLTHWGPFPGYGEAAFIRLFLHWCTTDDYDVYYSITTNV